MISQGKETAPAQGGELRPPYLQCVPGAARHASDLALQSADTIKLRFRSLASVGGQPSILLVYMSVAAKPIEAATAWPFTPNELRPVYTDLGQAFPGE
jgi:hypothetical protein